MSRLAAILTAPFHAIVFCGFAVAFGCCVVAAYGTKIVYSVAIWARGRDW